MSIDQDLGLLGYATVVEEDPDSIKVYAVNIKTNRKYGLMITKSFWSRLPIIKQIWIRNALEATLEAIRRDNKI